MEQNTSLFDFGVDDPSAIEMTNMVKWAKVAGITILVLVGLGAGILGLGWGRVETLFLYLVVANGSSELLVLVASVFAVLALILIIMMFFLVRGANRLKSSLRSKDQLLFNSGLGDIKVFFVFYGVIAVLGLVLNLFSLIK